MKIITFLIAIHIHVICLCQTINIDSLDKRLFVSHKSKTYHRKIVTSSNTTFYFYLKENNNYYRINILPKDRNDTLFNFIFVNNALARIDLNFLRLRKKSSYYYFHENKLLYKELNGMNEIDEDSLLARLPQLISDAERLRQH
jgi:hypothetical protein